MSLISPADTVDVTEPMIKKTVLMNLPCNEYTNAKHVAMLIQSSALLYSDLAQKNGDDAAFHQERLSIFYSMKQFDDFIERLFLAHVMTLTSEFNETLRLITKVAVKRTPDGH